MKKNTERRLSYWVGVLCLFTLALVFWRVKTGQWVFFIRDVRTPITIEPIEPSGIEIRKEAETAIVKTTYQNLEVFSFKDESSLKAWDQKVFKGKTFYEVRQEKGLGYLSSESVDASSGLFIKTRHEVEPGLWISWKWRVRDFPKKTNSDQLSSRSEDDFAARVYVIFLASSLFRSDVIEYVWDEKLPTGTYADSAYSDRIKLFVVRSGPTGQAADGWRDELQNPLEDYIKLFGKAPKHPIGIIALMSDSDNTRSQASADFAEIAVKKNITV